MKPQFPTIDVIEEFLSVSTPERRELVLCFQQLMSDGSVTVKKLVGEIGMEAAKNKLMPTAVLALGLAYGMALGVQMERKARRVV
jgi:hypothetical protein